VAGCTSAQEVSEKASSATDAPGSGSAVAPATAAPVTAAPVSAAPQAAPVAAAALPYDFAAHYADGKINSDTPVESANHRGALVLPVKVGGVDTDALTVIGTYRYTYTLRVARGESLSFLAGKPWPTGIGALGFVDATAGATSTRLFSATLEPSDSSGIHWHPFRTSLDAFAGKTVDLTFGTDVVGGDATATWVCFAKAAISGNAKIAAPKKS